MAVGRALLQGPLAIASSSHAMRQSPKGTASSMTAQEIINLRARYYIPADLRLYRPLPSDRVTSSSTDRIILYEYYFKAGLRIPMGLEFMSLMEGPELWEGRRAGAGSTLEDSSSGSDSNPDSLPDPEAVGWGTGLGGGCFLVLSSSDSEAEVLSSLLSLEPPSSSSSSSSLEAAMGRREGMGLGAGELVDFFWAVVLCWEGEERGSSSCPSSKEEAASSEEEEDVGSVGRLGAIPILWREGSKAVEDPELAYRTRVLA